MMEHVVRIQPKRVMDIGPGLGKWGFLAREALDFMPGRMDRDSWNVEIIGMDAYAYSSPILDWVYDRVEIGDAAVQADAITDFDLVIMGDVIEHFPKQDGLLLLDTLLRSNRNVLLTTPLRFFEQDVRENPYEKHLSHWSAGDFSAWTFDLDVVSGVSLVVLLAGRGAAYPDRRHTIVSRTINSIPGMVHHGSTARALKGLALRAMGSP
jgi:hypothetical protein